MGAQDKIVKIIRDMAVEYQKKLDDLISQTNSMNSETFWKTTRVHGERTLDRFRETQASFARLIDKIDDNEQLLSFFQHMSRCFDEMQALFLVLSERYVQDVLKRRQNNTGG